MKISLDIFKSEFVKNVLTLMTGTTIAQAIPIAITPILTRIYTPDDFGVLALFLSIVAISGAVANARFDQAIVITKSTEEAVNVFKVGFIISVMFSLSLFLIIIIFKDYIFSINGFDKLGFWIYFIPISTFLVGFFNLLNFYNVKNKKFKKISISLVARSTSLGFSQVLLGLITLGSFGLIVGQLISYLSGNYVLFKELKKDLSESKKFTLKNDFKETFQSYQKFPLFSLPSILVNSVMLNIIPILVTSFFSLKTLGIFTLSRRMIGIPSRLFGTSISQVYYQHASKKYTETQDASVTFIKTLKKLFFISLPIFTVIYFIAEPTFGFIFGKEWEITGLYTKIIIPLAFSRFIGSSLSPTVNIVEKQYISLIINISLLLATVLVFLYSEYKELSFVSFLKLYVIILSFIYLINIYIYWLIIKKKNNE